MDISQQLRDLYHTPAAGYRGVDDLYRKAREKDIPVSLKQVKNFLKSQDTYTKTFSKGGPGVRKKFRPTIVGKLGQQLQVRRIMTEMDTLLRLLRFYQDMHLRLIRRGSPEKILPSLWKEFWMNLKIILVIILI